MAVARATAANDCSRARDVCAVVVSRVINLGPNQYVAPATPIAPARTAAMD